MTTSRLLTLIPIARQTIYLYWYTCIINQKNSVRARCELGGCRGIQHWGTDILLSVVVFVHVWKEAPRFKFWRRERALHSERGWPVRPADWIYTSFSHYYLLDSFINRRLATQNNYGNKVSGESRTTSATTDVWSILLAHWSSWLCGMTNDEWQINSNDTFIIDHASIQRSLINTVRRHSPVWWQFRNW